ncbi:hypothetical protein OA002_03105 [bacterium]|nr:hypothetical protein [bacterium]
MRDQFTFDSLLPADLADALELIQQSLPTDPLSATGTLLTGYSGLFKIECGWLKTTSIRSPAIPSGRTSVTRARANHRSTKS